jgi:hypothetical protein
MVTTIPGLLVACAEAKPNQQCFVDYSSGPFGPSQPLTWTYGDSLQGALAAAAAFQIYEITGPVGILSRITHQSVLAEQGVLLAGGTLVPMVQEMIPIEYQKEQSLGLEELIVASTRSRDSGIPGILGETARYRLVRSIRQSKVMGIITSEEFLGLLMSIKEFLDPGFRIILIRDRGFFELPEPIKESHQITSRQVSAETTANSSTSFEATVSSSESAIGNPSITFGGNQQTQSMKKPNPLLPGLGLREGIFEFYRFFLDGMEAIKIQEIRNQLIEMAQNLDPTQPAMIFQFPNNPNRITCSHGQLLQKSMLLGRSIQLSKGQARVLQVQPSDEFLTRLALYSSWAHEGTFGIGTRASLIFRDFLPNSVLINCSTADSMKSEIQTKIMSSTWSKLYTATVSIPGKLGKWLLGLWLIPKIHKEFGTNSNRFFLLNYHPQPSDEGVIESQASLIQWFHWMKIPLKLLGVTSFYPTQED